MGYLSFLYRQLFVHPPQLPSTVKLTNQTILITGSTSGIGLSAAHECAKHNAGHIILGVRNLRKGESAKISIIGSNPESTSQISVWELDMNSFTSVLSFGKLANELQRLDIAILNAGIFNFEFKVSEATGIEEQVQVNHLSTALLSVLLLPVLSRTSKSVGQPSRMTVTSSEVHMWTPFKEQSADNILGRLNDKKFYKDFMDRYSVSKLLNVFWVLELASKTDRNEVVINLINPGSVDTGLHRDGVKLIKLFDRFVGRTPEEGARLLMEAAVLKGVESHGKYLSEAKIVEVSAFVCSPEGRRIQEKLWFETVALIQQNVPVGEFQVK